MAKKIVAQVGVDITGKEKAEMMRRAISQYNLALKNGFFLEATTLMESLICNRLESRLTELTNREVKMDVLGSLCTNVIKSGEKDNELLKIIDEIIIWKDQRNEVLHEAAKIGKGQKKTWEKYLVFAEETAEEGREIYDRFNRRLQKIRKK